MALWTDLINPGDLTGFSRTVADQFDADGSTLSEVFPSISTSDTNFKWFVNEKAQDVAAFRAYDAESKIGGASGLEEKVASLAAISLKKRFGEYDQLVRSSQNSPESVQAAADRLATEVAQGIMRRIVQVRAEALVTGKLAINDGYGEYKFTQNVDFGRRPDHTVTSSAAWDGAADPIVDLEQWRQAYVDHTGQEPTSLYASPKVVAALSRNDKVRAYLGSNAPALLDRATINNILAGYGLPGITVHTARVLGKAVLDENVIVFASAGAGATVWGQTIESTDPRYGLSDAALPGLVVGAYSTDDPATKWIHGNARALPILGNPDLTLAAKVLGV